MELLMYEFGTFKPSLLVFFQLNSWNLKKEFFLQSIYTLDFTAVAGFCTRVCIRPIDTISGYTPLMNFDCLKKQSDNQEVTVKYKQLIKPLLSPNLEIKS